MTLSQRINLILILLFLNLSVAGCATTPDGQQSDPPPQQTGHLDPANGVTTPEVQQSEPPPILAQDQLFRPYVKIGKIEVTRNVYAHFDYMIVPDIREWAWRSLRAEAEKLGADAVILPEVTGTTFTFMFVPSTE